MSNVGHRQLGEFSAPRKPIIKASRNPYDIATIVSIYPKAIDEFKHTIQPGKFYIAPGSFNNPAILEIGSSSWWMAGDGRPTLEIPVSSVSIANSVINDYSNGMLGCDMSTAMPGLFFVPERITVFDVKVKFKGALESAKVKQDNWFKILVRIADSLWARSNGNPLTISDEMRIAAKELNENNKPWLLDFRQAKLENCAACGTLKNPAYPICPTCKHIDQSHPAAKDLTFARG